MLQKYYLKILPIIINQMDSIEKNLDWSTLNLTQTEKILLTLHTTDITVWNDKENISMLQNLLLRIPESQQEITLYSGAEIPINQYTFGSSLNLKYFTSSYSLQVAEKYAQMQSKENACLFILTVPKGAKFVCLDNLSAHGNSEHEVLLSGDSSLCVTKIETNEKYLVVYATIKIKEPYPF